MAKVFIDGESGTTGLRLLQRIEHRTDVELIRLPSDERRCPEKRLDAMKRADITMLCLPDAAAKEAVALADQTDTRVIDASSAHRTHVDWVYGMPELSDLQAERIARAARVSVPGCHATGTILLTAPLVRAGFLSDQAQLSVTSLTGYSGGGKSMIAQYQTDRQPGDALCAPQPYALGQTHKHLPEIMAATGLSTAPVFMPIVGDYYAGTLVTIPLHASHQDAKREALSLLRAAYADQPMVRVLEEDEVQGTTLLNASSLAQRDDIVLAVYGNDDRFVLTALYDNVGKGASGAAIQCLNLMLGQEMSKGLAL